jgi:hypothetical protein
MRRCLYIIFLLITISFGWISTPRQSSAQPPYTGIDLLFIVDQSGSMGGADYGWEGAPTDPLGLRFEAVLYALDTLAEYRMSFNPDLQIRIAVIAFGDNTIEILDWTEIGQLDTPTPWAKRRETLLEELSADKFRILNDPDHLGNTNFYAAFEKADEMFKRLDADTNSNLRVLVTLTDGDPCVVEGPMQFSCVNLGQKQSFMEEVITFTDTTFPTSTYQQYALVLDAEGDLWERWQNYWVEVVNDTDHASRVESSQQVGVQFLHLLCEVLGQVSTEGFGECPTVLGTTNTIVVPPYQRLMRLSIFKSNTLPGVLTITLPDGSQLTNSSSDVVASNVDRPIEIWTINQPMPGEWRIEVGENTDRVDVFYELLPVTVTITPPKDEYRRFDTVQFRLSLLDDTGTPLPNYPGYKVVAIAETSDPFGNTESVELTPIVEGIYEGTLTATLDGEYSLSLNAEVQMPDGTTYPLYQSPTPLMFKVKGLRIENTTTLNDEYLAGVSIPVTAQVIDESATDIPLPDITITAYLENLSTGEIIVTELKPDKNELYKALLTISETGRFALRLKGEFEDSNGKVNLLNDIEIGSFSILPSEIIDYVILEPSDKSKTFTTEGLFFKPTTVDLIFETQIDSVQTPFNIDQFNTNPQLQVTVKNKDGKVVKLISNIESADTNGRYKVSLGNLEAGEYTVAVSAEGELSERYVLSAIPTQIRITRESNRVPYFFWIGIILASLIPIGLAGKRAYIVRKRHEHPAKGVLVIARTDVGGDNIPLKRYELKNYNSNYIVLKSKDLPRDFPFTKIIIQCLDNDMHKRKSIIVDVYKGREAVLSGKKLTPLQTVRLQTDSKRSSEQRGPTYQLIKDPEGDTSGGSIFG